MAQLEVTLAAMKHDHLSSENGNNSWSDSRGRKRKNPSPEKLYHSAREEAPPTMYLECDEDDDDGDNEAENDDDLDDDDEDEQVASVDISNISADYYNDLPEITRAHQDMPEFMPIGPSLTQGKKSRKSYYKPTGNPRGRPKKAGDGEVVQPGNSPSKKTRKSYYVPTGRPRGRPPRSHSLPATPATGAVPIMPRTPDLADELEDEQGPSSSPEVRRTPGFVMRLKDPLESKPKKPMGRPRGSEGSSSKLQALVNELLPKRPRGRPRIHPKKEVTPKKPRGRPRVRPVDEGAVKRRQSKVAEIHRLKEIVADQDKIITLLMNLVHDNGLELTPELQLKLQSREPLPDQRFVFLNSDGSIRQSDQENSSFISLGDSFVFRNGDGSPITSTAPTMSPTMSPTVAACATATPTPTSRGPPTSGLPASGPPVAGPPSFAPLPGPATAHLLDGFSPEQFSLSASPPGVGMGGGGGGGGHMTGGSSGSSSSLSSPTTPSFFSGVNERQFGPLPSVEAFRHHAPLGQPTL